MPLSSGYAYAYALWEISEADADTGTDACKSKVYLHLAVVVFSILERILVTHRYPFLLYDFMTL